MSSQPKGLRLRSAETPGVQEVSAPPSDLAPESTPQPAIPVLKRRRSRRRPVLMLVLLVAAVLGVWQGYRWWTVGRFIVWTDDAYVGAKMATLAAKVPGYIASLDVEDNAPVHSGDVIATIDDESIPPERKEPNGTSATISSLVTRSSVSSTWSCHHASLLPSSISLKEMSHHSRVVISFSRHVTM